MLVKRITFTAVFALLTASVAAFGVPTMAQSQDDGTVKQDKHKGWEKADNGSWVNPADDPRYPGASPSQGVVESRDDMDADGFKPEALIDNGTDVDSDDDGVAVTVQSTTVQTDTTQDDTMDDTTSLPADTTDTAQDDVNVDTQTDADVPATIDNSTVRQSTAVDNTASTRTTRRHTRLD